MNRSPITTHVLDTARGTPAADVPAQLFAREGDDWILLAERATNADGRIADWLPVDQRLAPGVYRIRFDTAAYFAGTGASGFYPYVDVVFEVRDPGSHYHVPLLLSPFGYATYRGS